MALTFPSTAPRRALVKVLGSVLFLRMRVAGLIAFSLLAWVAGAGSIAYTAWVWPQPNDPSFNPPTNPQVVRVGDTLTFIGTTPWLGRDRIGGFQRAIGDPLPPTLEPPFVHYGSRAVTISAAQGQRVALPQDLERDTRQGLFMGHLTALLALSGLFGFASRLLGRFRGPALTSALIARFVAASFIPSVVFGSIVGVLIPSNPFALEGAFAATLAANLLCLVLDPIWMRQRQENQT